MQNDDRQDGIAGERVVHSTASTRDDLLAEAEAGVEAPVGAERSKAAADPQAMGASEIQDAEMTTRIGRARMAGEDIGGQS